MSALGLPIATVRMRLETLSFRSWVVQCCPFCGQRHTHGAGRGSLALAKKYLGARVAHCDGLRGSRAYELVDEGEYDVESR